jgi:hypothetical protein
LSEIINKYSVYNLHKLIVDVDVLVDFFDKGIIRNDDFNGYFKEEGELSQKIIPTWNKLWRIYDLTDEEYVEYSTILFQELKDCKITKIEDIKHSFGLIFKFSDFGIYKSTPDEILSWGKEYINIIADEIKKKEDVEIYESLSAGYHSAEIKEFKELCAYIDDRIEELKIKKFPEKAEKLIEVMSSDLIDFRGMISLVNSGKQTYLHVPIFNYVDIDVFFSVFMLQSPHYQTVIIKSLQERYRYKELSVNLISEKSFLEALITLLTNESQMYETSLRHVRFDNYVEMLKASMQMLSE